MSLRAWIGCAAALLVASCSPSPSDLQVEAVLSELRTKLAPDPRLEVFNVTWERRNGGVVVRGDVGSPEAKTQVIEALYQAGLSTVADELLVLPDPALGAEEAGIVAVSVGNVRREPRHSAELTTQVLMGASLRLLKKQADWYFTQGPDGYLGWLDKASFQVLTRGELRQWEDSPKSIVTVRLAIVRVAPAEASEALSDVVSGCLLKTLGHHGGWSRVELPDRHTGFLAGSAVSDYVAWKAGRRTSAESVERTARSFLGIPYLWGGTSPQGFDCSGFTKTVFHLNGLDLGRDADQQAKMGSPVALAGGFKGLEKGDLLFFGTPESERAERITHVGIYLENLEFVHAAPGRVRVSSLDAGASNYDELHVKQFVKARRLLPPGSAP